MLNRERILSLLKKYNLSNDEVIILSGSALVLHGLREYTNDIDLALTKETLKKLLENYECSMVYYEDTNTYYYYIDDIINISNNWYHVPYVMIDGYRVQALQSILSLKESLNREKDKEDIIKIKKYLK